MTNPNTPASMKDQYTRSQSLPVKTLVRPWIVKALTYERATEGDVLGSTEDDVLGSTEDDVLIAEMKKCFYCTCKQINAYT